MEERDLWKILEEREHSWRRSIVDAIEGEGMSAVGEEVGGFRSESLVASNQRSVAVPPSHPTS